MRIHRSPLVVGLVLLLALLGSGARDPAQTHWLEDQWFAPDLGSAKFRKVLVLGITDDIGIRKTFENKFVSHLRGRGIECVTSYSIVPDLTAIPDPADIARQIRELAVDGVISVRLVEISKDKGASADAWATEWGRQAEADGRLRDLIDESLPMAATKSGTFGLEAALWETAEGNRLWAGRTNPYSKKQLQKGGGSFVESVMTALAGTKLL